MIAPNRLLHTFIDGMLKLLPDEPAESKRLIDIGVDDSHLRSSGLRSADLQSADLQSSDDEAAAAAAAPAEPTRESVLPESGVRAIEKEPSRQRAAS